MGNAAYKRKHKEQGLCIFCSQPAVYKNFCLKHYYTLRGAGRKCNQKNREERNKQMKDRRERLKVENKCPDCTMPLNEDNRIGNYCVNCYERKHRFE